MHPDNQFKYDSTILAYVLLLALSISILFCLPFGMAPADECANDLINRLSPWRVVLVTKADDMPAKYNHVRTWCESHITDYEHEIMNAVENLEEEPSADMYLDLNNRY